jgi:ADP-ribose pyrophosphatase YjhB (NUDIX family)
MGNVFNIRCYGLILKDSHVLVCKERYNTITMVKFPGGGLEFGEGLIDCLKRELKEELNVEIENIKHFYTTDFFQASAFNPKQQLISVYYTCELSQNQAIEVVESFHDELAVNKNLHASWIPLESLSAEFFTFPIDKMIVDMLSANCNE